jgi:Family of unknown function (DUF5677)
VGREDELAQRIAIINRTGNRLIDLVKVEFPRTIDRDAPAYRVALHGLVARTTGTMEAILHLAELRREADLVVLLRSLYDHTTVLAWLAGDPDANYPLWRAEDARQRVKIHNEWDRSLGTELLAPSSLAAFEQIAAETHAGPTNLIDRAIAADRYWADRLGFPKGYTPFVDAYQIVFRYSSSRTHASLQGLNDVIEETPDHFVVMLEATTGNQALAGRAVAVYALALRVSAVANGFPLPEAIEAAMAEYNTGRGYA